MSRYTVAVSSVGSRGSSSSGRQEGGGDKPKQWVWAGVYALGKGAVPRLCVRACASRAQCVPTALVFGARLGKLRP